MAACPTVTYGMWTNGIERFCYRRVVKNGTVNVEEVPDLPEFGRGDEEEDRPRFDRIPSSSNGPYLCSSSSAKLLQPEGPLGTYGSRVTACYCLGLIGGIVKADLKLMGKIRNHFAHDIRASFSSHRVSQWCRTLRWHKELTMREPPPNATDRDLFQVGINAVVTHLNGIPGLARTRKCEKVLYT